MSFVNCVEDAVRAGVLTRDQAEELYTRAQDMERTYRLDMQHSPESARAAGQQEALKTSRRAIRHKRYQAALQAIKNSENVTHIRSHDKSTAAGLGALLARDWHGKARYSNVDFRAKAILGDAHRTFADGLSAMRTTHLGLKQDKALIRDVIRELKRAETGNTQAKGLAELWRETAENLRKRFNRAGGAIPKRADWDLPQVWESQRALEHGKDTWMADMLDNIDHDAMTNSNGAVLSRDELTLLLDEVYESVSTDGLNKLIPGRKGGSKLANRRQQHRVLVFKDADAWLAMADKYGKPDLFSTMTDHLRSMSHDIALLEILGPNPNAAFRYLEDMTLKDGAGAIARNFNESLFNVVNGNVERNASSKLAEFSDAVRSWLVAGKLGSATLSAVSDIGFVGSTARWSGLPFVRISQQAISLLNPANEADRILATKMGLTAMQWGHSMTTAQRWSEITGRGVAGRFAEGLLRASGLTAWTDSWKRAFGMEFFGVLGDQMDRPLSEVAERTRMAMESYGIDSDMWNQMRAGKPLEHKGAKYLSVEEIMNREDLPIARREELTSKLQEMVLTEMNFAVPEPDARARVFTSGEFLFGTGARGTFGGEFGRGMFQFKGFPVSALLLHVFRAVNAKGGPMTPLAYTAQVVIATTLLGGLAIQLKDISKGKNPRPINLPGTATPDPKFWAAALIQGGGFGVMGDFLYSDVNRFGSGPISTLAGPFIDLGDDTLKLTLGQLWDVGSGRDMNLVRDVTDYSRRYFPGGSLWYARSLFEREVLDQIQLMGDREARMRFRRRERKRRREYNQTSWWRSGERLPRETPQLEEMVK